jgi:peptidyl-prolyl cis-trans isomerase D
MLQKLRNKAQSTFIQIIVVIIALVFIFWGVGTNMMGSRQAALLINDEEITFQEFQQAYDRAYERFSDQFGGNIPKGLAETLGIKQQVINQLIQTTLLRQGAEQMGIIVSGEEIQAIIKEMVQFQENGAFNLEQYKTVLASNRLAPSKFEASMSYDKLSETAAREIGNFVTVATDFETQDIFNQLNKQVSLNYLRISPSSLTDKFEVNDEFLSNWLETVKEAYKTDSQLKLKYLAFTYDSVGQKIDIDQAEIEKYYQANLSSYQIAEQRHARHILLKADENSPETLHIEKSSKAAEIMELARGGENFIELAKKYSEGPSKDSGGDLGFFGSGSMVPPFDAAVFAMKPGDISEVVKTRFGYHIILLEDIKPQTTRELADVQDTIIKTLQRKAAESMAFQVANNAYEGIIGAGSLEKYAEENPSAKIIETEFFSRVKPPETLAKDQQFIDKAFALNKGELSSLVKGRSGYAIFYAEDIIEPDFSTFEDVKDRLQADYIKKKSQELADKTAKELLDDVRSGKELKTVASEQGIEMEESGYLSQKEPDKNGSFPAELLSQAFLLSSLSPFPEEPGQVGDDYYLYSFTDSKIPELPENSDEMQQLKDDLLRSKQQQLLSAWLMYQEKNAKITQHQSL